MFDDRGEREAHSGKQVGDLDAVDQASHDVAAADNSSMLASPPGDRLPSGDFPAGGAEPDPGKVVGLIRSLFAELAVRVITALPLPCPAVERGAAFCSDGLGEADGGWWSG